MRVRGEYGFSSLLKQNKKAKICFVNARKWHRGTKNIDYLMYPEDKEGRSGNANTALAMQHTKT